MPIIKICRKELSHHGNQIHQQTVLGFESLPHKKSPRSSTFQPRSTNSLARNAFEELTFESRLGIVKKFGLPERLAKMTLEDVRVEWRLPHDNFNFLFQVVSLLGPKALTPYVNSLINSSDQQIQDAEADK